MANVGLADPNLESVPVGSLFESEPIRTARPAGSRPVKAFNVEVDVRHKLLRPNKVTPTRVAFILKGDNIRLTGDDNAACFSSLSNIRLEVEYERLP